MGLLGFVQFRTAKIHKIDYYQINQYKFLIAPELVSTDYF